MRWAVGWKGDEVAVGSRGVRRQGLSAVRRPCHLHMQACLPILPHSLSQTSRAEIQRKVEHGEELLSRFRHWEPLTREWCRVCVSTAAVDFGTSPLQAHAAMCACVQACKCLLNLLCSTCCGLLPCSSHPPPALKHPAQPCTSPLPFQGPRCLAAQLTQSTLPTPRM